MDNCSLPDGCGGCTGLDIDPSNPNPGDFDEVLFAERTSANGAIIRQYELACRVFAVQKSINNHWKATDQKWRGDVYGRLSNRRSISADRPVDTIISRYGDSLRKTGRAASIGMSRAMVSNRVSDNGRRNFGFVADDVNMVLPVAETSGTHHLIKHELNRYYTNDNAGWEAMIAAHHGAMIEPSGIFTLLGQAQATYSSIAAAATTQQRKKGNRLFGAIVGGVVGFVTGGYPGAVVGAVRGYAAAG